MTWSNSSAGSLGDAIPVRMSSLEKAISTDVIVEAEEGILEHTQGHQSPFILLGAEAHGDTSSPPIKAYRHVD